MDFFKLKNNVMRFFYLFIFVFMGVIFFTAILEIVTLSQGFLIIIPIVTIFVYVSYYQNFEKLLYFIWASVVFSSILAVFSDPLTQWTFRKTGGTGDPNEFAVHILAAMAITIYLFYKNKNHFFLWPSLGLFLYVLLYAGSKSSFLTLGILLMYAMIVKFRALLKQLFSFKVLGGVLVLFIIALQFNVMQMTAVEGMKKRAQTSGTADTRFVSWNAGMRMVEQDFFTGVGIEQYEKHAKAFATDYIAEGSFAPHNFLVKIIGEGGIFPFVTIIIFLIFLFTAQYRKIIDSDYFWVSLAALSTVIMGLTLSMTYEKYFWLFLGLLSHVVLVVWSEDEEGEVNENNAYPA